MISRVYWKRDYSLSVRQDFPPGVVTGNPIYEFMTCSRLNKAAVLESVDANPCRGIGGFVGWFNVWDDPFTGNAVESAFSASNSVATPVLR